MKFPEVEFKTLAFRLKGNKGEISSEIESKDSIYKKVEKKLEFEEKINKKSGINIPNKNTHPYNFRSKLNNKNETISTFLK